jgi:DNA replication ATP-dependent helicase Dna2
MSSAPLAVSSPSRQKLKHFLFAGASAETKADKENIDSNLQLFNNRRNPSETIRHSPQTAEFKEQGIFPRTPASKIPLAALISNTEDAFNGAQFDTTPEDHVSWQHGPRSFDSASSVRSTQRGKKRARSSSPASSSQIERSNHFSAVREPLDLHNLQQSLKTPQHDPATDLWARYSMASLAKTNGDNAALPPFAQFITSSPQTPETTKGRDSILQRSISCGIDWPTSKKKRRKPDPVEAYGRMRDVCESSKQDHLSHQQLGRSRVELLVGKIKESMLRKQSTFGREPSSSSPLPGRAGVAVLQPASPSPEKRAQQGQSGPETRQVRATNIPGEKQSDLDLITEDSGSSEFGDADLDLNFLETIEMTAAQITSAKHVGNSDALDIPVVVHNTVTVDERTDSIARQGELKSTRERDVTSVPQRASPRSSFAGQHESDDDEFAIEDDTAFATEMQDLAGRYDTQETTSIAFTTHPQKRQAHPLDSAIDGNMQRTSTDGGYENDFDDDGDDDLWDEIGKQSSSPRRLADVGSTSQVRVFF